MSRAASFMRRALAIAALGLAASAPAQAGRSCEAQAPTVASVQRGMALAERTAQALDASGAQVVVLARAGQDLRRYGLQWSHLGFAYREAAEAGEEGGAGNKGRWRVLHKLNECGSARGDLYRQGLGEFFMDSPFRYMAALAVLTPDAQAHLLPLLRDSARAAQLHTPAYSMVAYPWAQIYQQSNQWAIETLALAMEPGADTRARAQAWLQFKAYEPTVLKLSAFERLGARMTAANVAFDDHPNDKRYSDHIETVSADSVFDWLQRSGLAGAAQVVR
jgi:hypothetical protein